MKRQYLSDKPLPNWGDKERIENVKYIFSHIVPQYDLMNHLLTAGRDVAWRRFTAKRVSPEAVNILDIASGTGDLAIAFARHANNAQVCGIDFSRRMMEEGMKKIHKRGLNSQITFFEGDALALPFKDDSFDAAGAAFGIRNIPDKKQALREMCRVVKPRGKVLILEMTFPRNLKLRKFFLWYFNNIIPRLGRMLAGNQAAYQYLPDSIQDFLHPEKLTKLFKETGLENIREFSMTGGITYLHEGIVPGGECEI